MKLKDDQRVNLLSVTDPKNGDHHPWEIKLNWGRINVLPSGKISSVILDLDYKTANCPTSLTNEIDLILVHYAKCKINHFNLGKSLIEKVLKQIEK